MCHKIHLGNVLRKQFGTLAGRYRVAKIPPGRETMCIAGRRHDLDAPIRQFTQQPSSPESAQAAISFQLAGPPQPTNWL
jgi:hypothetical protein